MWYNTKASNLVKTTSFSNEERKHDNRINLQRTRRGQGKLIKLEQF